MHVNQLLGIRRRDLSHPREVLRLSVLTLLAVVSVSGLLYYLYDIDVKAHLPGVSLCPFRAISGIPCPGCGMTRAMLSLGQLEITNAIKLNPFSLPLLFVMILCLILDKLPSWLYHKTLIRLMFVMVVVIWLLRIT